MPVASPEDWIEVGDPTLDEAVVFVHGNPGSSRGWADLPAVAASRVGRAVAPTMPGFAETPPPRAFDFSVDAYAALLGDQLDRHGVWRTHLVMHDFGGAFGLTWAVRHRERVASIVCIDTGVLSGYRWHLLARIWRTPVVGEAFAAMTSATAFRLLLRRGQPRAIPRHHVDTLYTDFGRRARATALRLYRATDEPQLGRFADELQTLDVPTMVIWGAHDVYLPVSYAQAQRDVFADPQIHVLDASGHWPHLDDEHTVAALLADFLSTAAPPPRRAAGDEKGRTHARP